MYTIFTFHVFLPECFVIVSTTLHELTLTNREESPCSDLLSYLWPYEPHAARSMFSLPCLCSYMVDGVTPHLFILYLSSHALHSEERMLWKTCSLHVTASLVLSMAQLMSNVVSLSLLLGSSRHVFYMRKRTQKDIRAMVIRAKRWWDLWAQPGFYPELENINSLHYNKGYRVLGDLVFFPLKCLAGNFWDFCRQKTRFSRF